MPSCAVASCKNTNTNTVGKGIIYHCFPKNSEFQKLWEIKCKRSDPINFQNARVCSEHFKADDYKRDLRAELLNIPPKKYLKEEAVPSINLPRSSTSFAASNDAEQSFSLDDRAERFRQREVRKRALAHIACVSPKKKKVFSMVTSCSAFGCTNRKNKGSKMQFHSRFPSNEKRRIQWILALRRKDWQPSSSSRICSDHFVEEDFHRSLGQVRLKESAVPSIFKGFPSHFQKQSSHKQKVVTTKDLRKDDPEKNFSPVQTSTTYVTHKEVNQSLCSKAVHCENSEQQIFKTYNKKVVENILESTNLSCVDECSNSLSSEEILKQKLETEKKSLFSEDEIDENVPENTNITDVANDSELLSSENILKQKLETGRKFLLSEDEIDVDIAESTNNAVDFSDVGSDSEMLSSEEILMRKLEIMTAMYRKSQKKLKRCQEQCKFYVKRVIALEEVIDNLKKINSVTDYS